MSASAPSLCVVIPAYNDHAALLGCLESLHADVHEAPRIVVVDDGSSDATAEHVRRRFPSCELLALTRNGGFASACNAGFEVALAGGAECVLLLNQDTRVAPNMVARLAQFLRDHPRAGIVAPKTYSFDGMPDGGQRLIYAGSWQGWLPLLQRIPGIERADDGAASEPIRVDFAWGHGMLLRATLLRALGGFDATFPMYYEDLDLCRRARAAGWEVWCEPRAVMWHDQPDGARALRSEYWRWACKVHSTSIYYRKHHGDLAALALTPVTLLAELRRLVTGGRARAAGHLLRACALAFLGRGEPRRAPGLQQDRTR